MTSIPGWSAPTPASADQPTAVYGGDTITISAFKDASAPAKPATPPSASDDEYERQPDDEMHEEDEPFNEEEEDEDTETLGEGSATTVEEVPEEFMDESNPFFAAKKAQKLQAKQGPAAANAFKDTSDAAGDILRRLMERRRAEKG